MDIFDEWEIENFSCWSNDFHGELFKDETSPSNLEFYPRGIGGNCEHFVVRIHKAFIPSDSLLSFIGSDGSVICTRQSAEDWGVDWLKFRGPKFEEVVAGIRRNEPIHKDRLTLRWKTPKGYLSQKLHTVIDATSQFFRINPELFDSNVNKCITRIDMHLEMKVFQYISVKGCKTGSTRENTTIKFTLESSIGSKFKSLTSIWMAKGDSIEQKYEDYRVVQKGNQVLFRDIPFEDLFDKEFQTIMRCKIISDKIKYFRCHSDLRLPADTDFSRLSARNALENTSAMISNPTRESSSSPTKPELKPNNAVTVLMQDLVCLYQDQKFTDFEMRCDTVSFPTHKNILSARSPVFNAMLSGDMKEAACGHMDVDDLDPHTLGRFLTFLYSGSTGEEALQWPDASKLYYAADKYQVNSLKEECVGVLRDGVALENVCDILSLADKHQDEELRSVAHEFILENFNEVLRSDNWKKLMMSDPLLVAKTVTNFAGSIGVKKEVPTN